jgi:hypothetical protein
VNDAIFFVKKSNYTKYPTPCGWVTSGFNTGSDTRDPQRPSGCQLYRSGQSLDRLGVLKFPFLSRVRYETTVVCQ